MNGDKAVEVSMKICRVHTSFLTQQMFLASAMRQLELSRSQFASQIGVSLRSLEQWLLPCYDSTYQDLDAEMWRCVRELLQDAKAMHTDARQLAHKLG